MSVNLVAKGATMTIDLADEIIVYAIVTGVIGLMLLVLMFLNYWDITQLLPS